MRRKTVAVRILATLVAGATLLGLGACGSKSGETQQAAAGNQILFGGDSGSPTFTRNFNPFSTSKRIGINFIYEPLEVVNSLDGTSTPFLASGHKIVDPKTVEFQIRDGVKWSDGKPFSAQDVVFTFNLVKKDAAMDSLGVWQHISSLEASGSKVTFQFKDNDVPAVSIVSQQNIVPEHIWKSVKDPLKWTNENPVGTGPYKLDTFKPNQYTLAKNKDYWQAEKVAADTIVLPASNKQLDLVNKKYDWAYSFINNVDKTWVGADKQHNHYWFPPGGTVSLYPNLTKAPFSDVNFRKGLSYALDRDKIAKDAEEGYVDGATQTGLILPNHDKWVNDSIPNKGKVSQDEAQSLEYFAKAGYKKQGDQLVDSNGKQLEVNITVPSGYTDWLRGVQTMQGQLTKLGIAVKLTQPQPAAYTQAQNNGDYDLLISSFGGTGSVFQDYNGLLNSEFAVPVGQSANANFERYKNPKADELLAQLKQAADEKSQKDIVDQLQQIVYDDVPVIGLFYGGLWGLFSTRNYTGWPSEDDPYTSPSTWTQSVLMVVTHIKKA